jgi:hypothetical protein
MLRDQGAGALLLVHDLIVGQLNGTQHLIVSRPPKRCTEPTQAVDQVICGPALAESYTVGIVLATRARS